jgi:Flp pilus assembly protein TadG
VVELAFVLPIVLLILFGIIDFGLALNNQNADTNLANLAARSASVMPTTPTTLACGGVAQPTLTAYVTCEAAATGAPVPSKVCFTTGSGLSTLATGDSLTIKVQSTFNWLRLVIGGTGSLTSTISASATMRIEQAPTNGTNNFWAGQGC